MQSSQEGPAPSKRPSLLGAEQPEQSDSQRLLAGIEAGSKPKNSAAKPPSPPSRKTAWVVALLVLAAAGGTAAWMNSGSDEPVLAVAAPVSPAPARQAAPVAAVASTAASIEAPDVSTAAILHDTTADEDKAAQRTVAAAAKPASKADTEALTALLEDKPAAPARKAAKERDDSATAESKRAAERTREKRLALRDRLKKEQAEKHPLARNVVAKKAAAPEVDTDVALLAALVAHSKASQQATRTSAPASGPDAKKLRQCKALSSVAEAEECRARLCTGSAKTSAACKPASVAQVSDAPGAP